MDLLLKNHPDLIVGTAKTASDYVQNGLVALFDGIENVSCGSHSSSPSSWVDLIGGKTFTVGGNADIFENAIRPTAFCAMPTDVIPKGSYIYSVEYCYTCPSIFTLSPSEYVISLSNNGYQGSIYGMHIYHADYGVMKFGVRILNADSNKAGFTVADSWSANGHFTLSYSPDAGVFSNGVSVTNKTDNFGYNTSCHGGLMFADASTQEFPKLHSIRVYNRSLTADEVAANYAIDQARFFSSGPKHTSPNFCEKCTSIYIGNCNKVFGKRILDDVIEYQGGTGKTRNLVRFRVDLPYDGEAEANKHTGTYDELMSYALPVASGGLGLMGYTSEGTEQDKPVFVGTWTVSDYTDADMRTAAASVYGENEPTIEFPAANQLPAWADMSVQSINGTAAQTGTWNPAVAIVLQANGKGTVHENTQHWQKEGYGKWWLTKTEAAEITSIGTWFKGKSSNNVTDTSKIVNSKAATAQSYSFTDFSQFSDFTGVTTIDANAFYGCSCLSSFPMGSQIVSIGDQAFQGCTTLTALGELSGVTSVGTNSFNGCSSLTSLTFTGKTHTEVESITGFSNFPARSTCVFHCSDGDYYSDGTSLIAV